MGRGISITPRIPGIWRWESDRRLTFTPKEDWAVGQDYEVRFEKALFADFIRLERYSYSFKSAPFAMQFSAAEFYQDPVNPKLKKVVATVSFSHPVDPADFEKHVFLQLAGQSGGFLGLGAKSYPFIVTYDKYKSAAYIHSDPVDIPMNDTYMLVSLSGGVRASRGGPAADKAERQVPIPGMYNFFRIQSAELTLVRNERFEPERALVLQLSAGALESEIQKSLTVYELPQDLPSIDGRPARPHYRWSDPERIGKEVLALSKPVKLEPLPTDREYATLHSFKFEATPGRYLFLQLKKGIKSYGGYILARTSSRSPPCPSSPRSSRSCTTGPSSASAARRRSPSSRGT